MICVPKARAIVWFLVLALILVFSILTPKYSHSAEKAISSKIFFQNVQQANENFTIDGQDKSGLWIDISKFIDKEGEP